MRRLKRIAVAPDGLVSQEAIVDGSFCKQFERGPIALVAEDHPEPNLIVLQVDLASNAEQLTFVDQCDIFDGRRGAAVATEMLMQVVEELLDVVRNAAT